MNKWIVAQFGQPRGLIGGLVGRIMARQNRERIAWAVTLLDLQPTDHVLEIGCGPGVGVELIAQRAGFVAGLDHSGIMVAQATRRNRAAIASKRAEVVLGSVAALPYPAQRFTKALAINSHHFWPEPVANLGEVGRVLKAHGHLLVVAQPRWAKTTADVEQEGERIAGQLATAGFVEIQKQFGSFQPRAAVAVLGIKADGDV